MERCLIWANPGKRRKAISPRRLPRQSFAQIFSFMPSGVSLKVALMESQFWKTICNKFSLSTLNVTIYISMCRKCDRVLATKGKLFKILGDQRVSRRLVCSGSFWVGRVAFGLIWLKMVETNQSIRVYFASPLSSIVNVLLFSNQFFSAWENFSCTV